MDNTRGNGIQQNEGEGNKTAAREYNEAQHRFAQSGRVEQKAREAAAAMASPERAELERAEAIGRQGGVHTLTQQAGQQASQAGDYLASKAQEYPFSALLVAGLIGYGIRLPDPHQLVRRTAGEVARKRELCRLSPEGSLRGRTPAN